ncbi:hypothetical protein WS70_21560 [Burkholderia mayonis]|uniref:Uncharacterized protein n=1 Tax=Burkholderia mayonis TaxID=1385591 RepID=A0A1B4FL95_9BURK|nr:hypothetical protein WS70_21560 [Burkholderia mayonis]KVE37813.1 hypothetical protein WS69_10050 [Burkholderia sp. BDU5]KVE41175.1 hypothetical protein WS70_15410 [Burkholderia mayonis]
MHAVPCTGSPVRARAGAFAAAGAFGAGRAGRGCAAAGRPRGAQPCDRPAPSAAERAAHQSTSPTQSFRQEYLHP